MIGDAVYHDNFTSLYSLDENDTTLGKWSVLTTWEQLIKLFAGNVLGYVVMYNGITDIFDDSGSSPDSQDTTGQSSARDTSLRRYIYSRADAAVAGCDPTAPGNAGAALEELSRNISVALTQV